MPKRPQNGPSFSKAPYKKPKPLTDEELAKAQARQKEREEQLKDKAARGQRFKRLFAKMAEPYQLVAETQRSFGMP
jgi:flagellar motility protein MotE (MotC chaperone)